MIRLILTDLDDTLIPAGAHCLSGHAARAIHAALDAGVRFGPVSGRPPYAMQRMFAGDEALFSTGVYVNGQVIYIDGELVCLKTVSGELLEKVATRLEGIDEAYACVFGQGFEGSGAPRESSSLLGGAAQMRLVARDPKRLETHPPAVIDGDRTIIGRVPEGEYYKANVRFSPCSRKRMVEVRDMLVADVPELDYVFPSNTAPVLDILPKGWDKGCGVRLLADLLGVAPDEVVAFGDSDNDLAMLRAVPNPVAVANANDDVKRVARWQIGSCEDDAVADAILDVADAFRRGAMPSFMR